LYASTKCRVSAYYYLGRYDLLIEKEHIAMANNAQIYLVISGIIFGIVSLLHLFRVISGWPFVFGPMDIPIAVSWVAFLITALLCGWALWLGARA